MRHLLGTDAAPERGLKDRDEPVELEVVDVNGVAVSERATDTPPSVDLVGRDVSDAEPDEMAVHVVGDTIGRRRLHPLADLVGEVIEAETCSRRSASSTTSRARLVAVRPASQPGLRPRI